MVLENTVNNLRERPRDQRKAIAGIVAIAVIGILFLGWAVLFFKKIQNAEPIRLDSVRDDFVESFPSADVEGSGEVTQ